MKDPQFVEVPQLQVVEKVTPHIINVNKYIERIVEKLIEVPYLLRETQVQDLVRTKPQAGPQRHTVQKDIIQLTAEKELYVEVEKKVVDTVHRIDEVLRTCT